MIYDADLDIAAAAGMRWVQRMAEREAKRRRPAVEAEPPERVQARVDRLQQAARSDSILRVPSDAVPPDPAVLRELGLERTFGQSDFQNIAFLELALAVSRFVGRVNIRTSSSRIAGFGTGSMVSPRLLLTNNHVLPNAGTAGFSLVEFDYQVDRNGRALQIYPFRLRPDLFFLTDVKLDYSLVAVDERSSQNRDLRHYGWTRLIESQGKIMLKEHVNIIQHPRGQYKQFVTRNNELVDILDNYLHYVTDTEPGSSGSPVYNDQWEMVALHHAGVPKMIGDKIADKRGQIWDGSHPDDIAWIANEGIRTSRLVEAIKAARLSGEQARMREELLNLEPPNPIEAAQQADETLTPTPTPPPETPTPSSSLPPDPGGSRAVTITIPLKVTVELGDPLDLPRIAAVVPASPAPPPAPPISPRVAPDAPQTPELTTALAELSRASARPYYDAAADARARDAYYAGVEPGRRDRGAFYRLLSDLVTRTHKTKLRYSPATQVYPWVDLREGSPPRIKSLYSGKGFDPRELIEADFAVEAQRKAAAEAVAASVSGMTAEGAEAMLEAQLPYNCEHVVPQSWFEKREPMRGDLHHLFACESGCNSFRGNSSYFDFPDFEEALRSECGKREKIGFEPDAGKGAAARATLYFLLRYPGLVGDRAGELGVDRIATLIAWHKREPVGIYERHRNAAIAEKQGNRNPLIDFPDWAERIDFARGLSGPQSGAGDGEDAPVRDLASAVAAIAALDLTPSLVPEAVAAAEAAQFGHYIGLPPKVSMLDDGRRLQLLADLIYIEESGTDWPVPKDWVVDGASIPRIFWTLIGGPLEGEYRNASIIHDHYCDTHARAWRETHRMFYEAMRCSGMGEAKAKILYYAVYRFGPRWSLGVEAVESEAPLIGRPPTDRDAPTLLADAEAIYVHDLDLDEIDNLADARDMPAAIPAFATEAEAASPALDRARRLVITGGHGNKDDLEAVAREAALLQDFVMRRFERKRIRIIACREGVTDFERKLRGKVPRGWEGTGRTWDDVPGTYLDGKKRVVIATIADGQSRKVPTRESRRHGTANLTVHEALHGYDYSGDHAVLGDPAFVNAREADMDRLHSHERLPGRAGLEETFAESGARFVAEPGAMQTDWASLFVYWQGFLSHAPESLAAADVETVAIPSADPDAPIGTILKEDSGRLLLDLRAEGPDGAIGHAMIAIASTDEAHVVVSGQLRAHIEATEGAEADPVEAFYFPPKD